MCRRFSLEENFSPPNLVIIANPLPVLHSLQRETQISQESHNEVIDLQTVIHKQNLLLKEHEQENSAIGSATEIATESSSETEGEPTGTGWVSTERGHRVLQTPEKVERARKLKEESRRVVKKVRKEKARVFNLRLSEAFDAGTEQVKKDTEDQQRKGCKLVYLSSSGRRSAIRSLGKAYKRGVRTAIEQFHNSFSWSSGAVYEQPKG